MKKVKKDSKKKRKKSEEKKKESKLEEGIKEVKKAEKEIEQDFFEEPVRQIPIAEIGAPVLERIIQRETISTQISAETEQEKNEKRIDYSPNSNQPNYGFQRNTEKDEEKKYETNFAPPVLTRREMPSNATRQEFINPQAETWSNKINESKLNEIEFIEEERRLPFEEEQKKYKRFKLR
jgi:hypothetical protein